MLETIALPAATAPPSGDLRPSGQAPGVGEAGQTPFKDVLAAAQAAPEPEPDAAPPAPAEDPAALSALAALLAQLFNQVPAAPVEAPAAPAAQAEAQVAPAVDLTSQPAPAPADLEAQAAPAVAAPAAENASPDFAALAAKLTAQADMASVSADAQAAQTASVVTPRQARHLPVATPATAAPQAEPAPAVVTAQPPLQTAPQLEPARLAEAQNPTPAVRPEVVLPQVLRGVESLVRSGATTLNLHLYPEALGRIDVQVTTNADGLRVMLTADSAATGGLLQQNLSDLRQSLSDSGLNIQALSVGIGQGQAGQQMPAWQRPPHPAGPAAGTRQPAAASAEATPAPVLAGASTRVDYRI